MPRSPEQQRYELEPAQEEAQRIQKYLEQLGAEFRGFNDIDDLERLAERKGEIVVIRRIDNDKREGYKQALSLIRQRAWDKFSEWNDWAKEGIPHYRFSKGLYPSDWAKLRYSRPGKGGEIGDGVGYDEVHYMENPNSHSFQSIAESIERYPHMKDLGWHSFTAQKETSEKRPREVNEAIMEYFGLKGLGGMPSKAQLEVAHDAGLLTDEEFTRLTELPEDKAVLYGEKFVAAEPGEDSDRILYWAIAEASHRTSK